MKRLLLSLLFAASACMAAGPCDGQPHVNNGITLTCQAVDSRVVLTVGASSTLPNAARVTVGYHVGTQNFRKVGSLNGNPPWPFTASKIMKLSAGAVVDFISVEELQISNSAGFGQ